MSRLEELIQELCPDGVEYKKIGELAEYEQPSNYIVKSTDYNDNFDTPVLTAGQTFILGYTSETSGVFAATKENPVIIFDDFTGAFKWVDFPFKVKSSAMKMIKAKRSLTSLRYVFHLMGFLNYTSSDHKRLWISVYSELLVPVPPLPVQREIVRILDNFTEVTAQLQEQLTQELTARRKQYEYYRDKLLTASDFVDYKTLPDISFNCDRQRKPVTKGSREAGEYPYYGASGIVDYVSDYIFNGDYLLISEDGANLLARSTPIAFPISGKSWVNNHAHVIQFDCAEIQKYVEIYLNSIDLSRYISGGAQPKLNQDNLNKIPIPVPPFEKVKKIVAILTKFDTLCSALASGLPAEIEARQKQYEYYRDKLLNFKELTA